MAVSATGANESPQETQSVRRDYPILEYDPQRQALIEPRPSKGHLGLPGHCVICFFREVVDRVCSGEGARQVACERSEMGEHPVHEIEWNGRRLGVFHPGVGAPMAAALLEHAIVAGAGKFIACGGAGVLDRDIAVGHLIVPTSAVRDEGTSYHYLPPSREVEADTEAVAAIETVLRRRGVHYRLAKTWTTDAFFRETPDKVRLRREEGCLTVEMEAAAFFAVARFRGVSFGQILYGGDDLSGEVWDSRDWNDRVEVRERLFWLAAEACLEM